LPWPRSRCSRSVVGDRAAALKRLAQGDDDRDVESALLPKIVGEENTFERDVVARDVITATLTRTRRPWRAVSATTGIKVAPSTSK